MDQYTIKAYAKINLGLDVTGRLPNGYHQVKMIMQTVGICDVLTIEKRESGISLASDSDELPLDENNLIYKAAKLMRDKFKIREGVHIHLQKNIPIAAGMAGGSTDAAAAMRGMAQLFELEVEEEKLMEMALPVGADVPYCVMGGTALAEGIGEKLTALPPVPGFYLVAAKPDINVSTKYVYEHLDAAGLERHPDIDGMVEAIRRRDLPGITKCMENVLETVTIPAYPVIDTIKARMRELGAVRSLMSGSGPTVFGVFMDGISAGKAYEKMKQEKLAKQIFLSVPLSCADIRMQQAQVRNFN